MSEGNKQAAILNAEGERQASILRAEGTRQAAILNAEGFASALSKINEAADVVGANTMSLQYLDALKALGVVTVVEGRGPDGAERPRGGLHRHRRRRPRDASGERRHRADREGLSPTGTVMPGLLHRKLEVVA